MPLERILGRVSEINRIVADIANGAQEQAGGLKLVNGAINQMDEATQGFAAMASQTSAATQRLNQASEELASLVGEFRLAGAQKQYAEAA